MAVQLFSIVQVSLIMMWLEASLAWPDPTPHALPSVVHVATHVEKQKCKPVVNKLLSLARPLFIQFH